MVLILPATYVGILWILFQLYKKAPRVVSNLKEYTISSFPANSAPDPFQRDSYVKTISPPPESTPAAPINSSVCGYFDSGNRWVHVPNALLESRTIKSVPTGKKVVCLNSSSVSKLALWLISTCDSLASHYKESLDAVAGLTRLTPSEVESVIVALIGLLLAFMLVRGNSWYQLKSTGNKSSKKVHFKEIIEIEPSITPSSEGSQTDAHNTRDAGNQTPVGPALQHGDTNGQVSDLIRKLALKNGEIEKLKQELRRYEGKITDLEHVEHCHGTNIEENEESIAKLEKEVAELEEDNQQLEKDKEELVRTLDKCIEANNLLKGEKPEVEKMRRSTEEELLQESKQREDKSNELIETTKLHAEEVKQLRASIADLQSHKQRLESNLQKLHNELGESESTTLDLDADLRAANDDLKKLRKANFQLKMQIVAQEQQLQGIQPDEHDGTTNASQTFSSNFDTALSSPNSEVNDTAEDGREPLSRLLGYGGTSSGSEEAGPSTQ